MSARAPAGAQPAFRERHPEALGETRIRQAGFWTVLIGESNQTLYYLLQWQDLAEREQKWNAFSTDPEWLSARAESEKDGPILANVRNSILQPTPYSSVR